ncbi:MAG: trypsin-like peptidase domain-containing protein [Rudaea sp.]
MSRPIRLLAAIVILLVTFAARAGVYKWKDANGNLHFSDTPPPADASGAAQGSVQEVQLSADTADVQVAHKIPIPNPTPNGGPVIGFDSFTLKLDNANGNNVTIGREFHGSNCSQSADIVWNDGILDLKGRHAASIVAGRFRNFGYRFVDDSESAGMSDLLLDAELLAIKLDLCNSVQTGNLLGPGSRAYVKVRWSLHRKPGTEPVYRGISAGYFDAWHAGAETRDTLLKAIAAAADNLLGERNFVDALGTAATPEPESTLPNASVKVTYSHSIGSFRMRSQTLLRSAITVKTTRGHGSGVLIDPAGYALTNAHVVGDEKEVKVMLDDDFVDARVVHSDRKADIALLAFDPHGHDAASIAAGEPKAGDPLYVVGTPLSLKLNHTVTEGILSAVREDHGMRFYQTDAAVSPGNSGGPVFDANGDLVALTVSGIFNAEGASMNVNYLIPIGRALTAVGIGRN